MQGAYRAGAYREHQTTHRRRNGIKALESEHDVVEAADGLDGIRAFHRSRPNLVVLDAVSRRGLGYTLLSQPGAEE